jgi:uncharacterized Zn finger protein
LKDIKKKKEELEAKTLREVLYKYLEEGNKKEVKSSFCEAKKKMRKASRSFKSLMEVRSILVNVYEKLLQKSGTKK